VLIHPRTRLPVFVLFLKRKDEIEEKGMLSRVWLLAKTYKVIALNHNNEKSSGACDQMEDMMQKQKWL